MTLLRRGVEQFTSRRTRAVGVEAEEEAATEEKEEEEEEGGGWWEVDDGVQCMTRARLRQKVLGQTSHNTRARASHSRVASNG